MNKEYDAKRGLTTARYINRFNAGARSYSSFPDLDLDERLYRYKFKSDAEEQAFLDGNTYGDEDAEEFLARRENGDMS